MASDFEIATTVDITDLQRLAKKMDVLPALFDGVEAAGVWVEGEMSEYPPATQANMPGPYPKRWYVRGTGSFWALKNGGFHSNHTSETLGRRWTTKSVNDGYGAVIGNNASYAGAVYDKRKQSPFLMFIGWPTVQDFVGKQSGHVRDIIADFIRAKIEGKR